MVITCFLGALRAPQGSNSSKYNSFHVLVRSLGVASGKTQLEVDGENWALTHRAWSQEGWGCSWPQA